MAGFITATPVLTKEDSSNHEDNEMMLTRLKSQQAFEDPNDRLQEYDVNNTVAGGPPFHHDVLCRILVFVSDDLKTLKTISAVRRSWRFFSAYHQGWRKYSVQERQVLMEDWSTDLKSCPVFLIQDDDKENPTTHNEPYTRESLHNDVQEKVEEAENGRPSKVRYWLGSTTIAPSAPLFLVSFILFAILACFPISAAGNEGEDGRVVYQRRGEKDSTGFDDGRVFLVGIKDGLKQEKEEGNTGSVGTWLRMKLCNGYVETTTSCSTCTDEDGNSYDCCSTTIHWDRCTRYLTYDNNPFVGCNELQRVAKRTVQWNVAHSVFAMISPLLFFKTGFVLLVFSRRINGYTDKNDFLFRLRIVSLGIGLPLQICLMISASGSLHYADRLGKTPCDGWSSIMMNDGGGDVIKAKDNGWSTHHGLRMMTIPLIISLTIGAIVLVVYFLWFLVILSDAKNEARKRRGW